MSAEAEIDRALEEILLADELQTEMRRTGHSLLRVVAERLIEERESWRKEAESQIVAKEPDLDKCVQLEKELDLSVTPYQRLLTDLLRTEKAIATDQDYIDIMEKEDQEWVEMMQKEHPDYAVTMQEFGVGLDIFGEAIEGATAEQLMVAHAESTLDARQNGKKLQEDPSGFSLVVQFCEKYVNSPSSFLKRGQSGREQAVKDFKTMYLVGARAGLGPLPKK